MHKGGGRWVGSNKLVELKKKKSSFGFLACVYKSLNKLFGQFNKTNRWSFEIFNSL